MKKLIFIVAGQLFFILGMAQEYISNQTARQEYAHLLKQRSFIAFPELREQPIRWLDSVKKEWLEHDYAIKPFVLHPQPGEYFVFQINGNKKYSDNDQCCSGHPFISGNSEAQREAGTAHSNEMLS